MTGIISILIVLLSGIFYFFRSAKRGNDNITYWKPEVEKASKKSGVPEPIIFAVIEQESDGNPSARGSADEKGLMQLKDIAVNDLYFNGLSKTDRAVYDPEQNILHGAMFLKLQKDRVGNNWYEILRAYNQGYVGSIKDPLVGRNYALSVLNKSQKYGFTGTGLYRPTG